MAHRFGRIPVLLKIPDLELVVRVVRVVRPHEVELCALPLLAGLDTLLEALTVLSHEARRLVDDRSDVRRGVDYALHLKLRGGG